MGLVSIRGCVVRQGPPLSLSSSSGCDFLIILGVHVYVGDQLETWTVLKASDGCKTGQTDLAQAQLFSRNHVMHREAGGLAGSV